MSLITLTIPCPDEEVTHDFDKCAYDVISQYMKRVLGFKLHKDYSVITINLSVELEINQPQSKES
jgi:hypothetical protein